MASSSSRSLAPQMTLTFTAFSRVFLWWKNVYVPESFTKTSKFWGKINISE